MLYFSNYDFSKALQSGATIFSLLQYHAISILCWQSFSPSPADELQVKEGTSQPGTRQLEVASFSSLEKDVAKRISSPGGKFFLLTVLHYHMQESPELCRLTVQYYLIQYE